MRLRYYPPSNSAPMAQPILRRCWIFPRQGDSAKVRAITPRCDGAPMAQARLACIPEHPLCAVQRSACRRRSEGARWPADQAVNGPADNHLARGLLPRARSVETEGTQARAPARVREGWIDLSSVQSALISAIPSQADRTLIRRGRLPSININAAWVTVWVASARQRKTALCRPSRRMHPPSSRSRRNVGLLAKPVTARQKNRWRGWCGRKNKPLAGYSMSSPDFAPVLLQTSRCQSLQQ